MAPGRGTESRNCIRAPPDAASSPQVAHAAMQADQLDDHARAKGVSESELPVAATASQGEKVCACCLAASHNLQYMHPRGAHASKGSTPMRFFHAVYFV